MKKWYQESYFNSRNWILENFEKLNINNDELVLLLLIDYARENNLSVSYDYLSNKLKMNNSDIDKIIASLVEKSYLKIKTNSKGIVFDISNIFEFDPNEYEIIDNKDIYEVMTEVFNRPLSPTELQKTSDLINAYGQNKFNDALRMAEAYHKLNIAYIETILKNENK